MYHLVDSNTELGYLHKQESNLKLFEGACVSEVQTLGTFTDGILYKWGWIEGQLNPTDWATKPRSVSDLL